MLYTLFTLTLFIIQMKYRLNTERDAYQRLDNFQSQRGCLKQNNRKPSLL